MIKNFCVSMGDFDILESGVSVVPEWGACLNENFNLGASGKSIDSVFLVRVSGSYQERGVS